MGLVTLTQISNGEDADATTVDSNFDALAAELNGGLENVNIDAAAGITAGKLLPCRTATTVAGIGGSPGDGALAQLRINSANDFVPLVYDATANKWISARFPVVTALTHLFTTGTSYTTPTYGTAGMIHHYKAAYDAGLRLQLMIEGWFLVASAGQTAYATVGAWEWNDGDNVSTTIYSSALFAGGSPVEISQGTTAGEYHKASSWGQPTITPTKNRLTIGLLTKIAGGGSAGGLYPGARVWGRWVSA